MPKLKVYRTSTGFHDAYVAAPSQKAALAAWGSDANLFARGVAEVVTDPALTEKPLANPGQIIKRLRGTAAEQIAALPPDPIASKKREPEPKERGRLRQPKKKVAPRPDRSKLDAAEQAVNDAERRHREQERRLARKEEEVAREQRDLARQHEAELRRLQQSAEKARRAYQDAMEKWTGE
jgi:hypothetical protein